MTSDSMRDNPNLIAVPVIVSFNTRGEAVSYTHLRAHET